MMINSDARAVQVTTDKDGWIWVTKDIDVNPDHEMLGEIYVNRNKGVAQYWYYGTSFYLRVLDICKVPNSYSVQDIS